MTARVDERDVFNDRSDSFLLSNLSKFSSARNKGIGRVHLLAAARQQPLAEARVWESGFVLASNFSSEGFSIL